ncbi:RHS repeat-associated core domain-containing protein [Polyangium sp. y55x31]|uniref:RHS repeat-associated core domain-containing protein n=1 Tax=Polyangium sp. y55x31 TaxID=3042688 RepID=UPI0024827A74|nr:RHS repeat-associated core domain-containing protein [Polyangium sp. y55x31]MDI1477254.1 RHS repeat-associated core domain-containing protein [Polyangium sp. y55x31]
MATTVRGKNVATTGSGHVAPGPPATSMIPPPPPTGPVASPFLYVARSSTAKSVCQQITCGGDPVLKKGSTMDIETPANLPANALPIKDIVTHAVLKVAKTISGSKSARGSNVELCVTGDDVVLNLLSKDLEVHQSKGKFISGLSFTRAMNAKSEKHAAKVYVAAEPVAVASGDVVDTHVDYELHGPIPVRFYRHYASSRAIEATPLGRGGFSHSFHQYVTVENGKTVVRGEDGRDIVFPALSPRQAAFHRGRRMELAQRADGKSYELQVIDDGYTLTFTPITRTGPAMLRSIEDAWGNRVELVYAEGRLRSVIDAIGREIRLSSDSSGRIVQLDVVARGAIHATLRYAYTDAGELASVTDPLGHTERYAYDGRHRLVEKRAKNGVSWRYAYDPENGRCIKAWGDGGLHGFEFTYDLTQGTTTAHGNPAARVFTWNEHGAVLEERSFDGEYVDANEYDGDLLVVARKNGAGEAFVYEYDARGHLVKATDPAGNVATWEYEGDRMMAKTDAAGLTTRYTYDGRGALIRYEEPSGNAFSLAYDGRGLLVAMYGPDGTLLEITHDAEGNIAELRGPLGEVTHYESDALGRLVQKTDPTGAVTRYAWDALGRLTAETLPDGGQVSFTYDALGCPTTYTTERGHTVALAFRGTGQVAGVVEPDGGAWTFLHDVDERLRFVRNPKGEQHEFVYDRASRVREEVTFDGRLLRYFHARTGRMTRVEYPDGTWRSFEYDPGGRVVVEDSPHGTRTFERNELGEILVAVVEETWGKSVVEFEFDKLHRIVGTAVNGRATKYEYDKRGRLVARVLPNGKRTSYFYDLASRVVGIDHDGHKVLLVRDMRGREVRRHVYEAALDILTTYGPQGWPVDRTAAVRAGKGPPNVISRRAWQVGLGGLPMAMYDLHWGTVHYEHDACGRLTTIRSGARAEVLDYDAAGSLSRWSTSGTQSAPWAIRQGNVLLRTPDLEFGYDDNGRRIEERQLRDHRPEGRKETKYYWDAFQKLREVELPSGERLLFTYDAFGRRIRKQVIGPAPEGGGMPPARVVEYLWDVNTLAAEMSSEGTTRAFVGQPFSPVPVLHEEDGKPFFYVTDHLGTAKDLVDARGEIAWTAEHSVFGRVLQEKGNGAGGRPTARTPLRLLGQYADDETGLVATRHRIFDPRVGRWLSPDPLGLHGSPDLFGFGGNPTTTIDPLGLAPCPGLGYVKFTTDANGYINGMQAKITKDMCQSGLGTDAYGGILPPGWISPGYDRAHLWPNRMGGPGDWEQNLVTMRAEANQTDMRMFEDRVFQAAQKGPVDYDVSITNYGNGRPKHVTLSANPSSGTPFSLPLF